MKEYTFYVLGRERGAIGLFYWSYKTVTSSSCTMAEYELRQSFEVVSLSNTVEINEVSE